MALWQPPQKFVSCPTTIDAMQYTAETCAAIHFWMGEPHLQFDDEEHMLCETGILLNANEVANIGDWVCRDVNGFYSLPDDQFRRAYTPVRHRFAFRRWMVTAMAGQPSGRLVASAPVSRHLTLRSARRAVARYAALENPNPKVTLTYRVHHATEVFA